MVIRELIATVRKLNAVKSELNKDDRIFARSLINNFEMYGELTDKQFEWVETLIARAEDPQDGEDESEWIEASELHDLLWHAQRKGLSTPRIKIIVNEEQITVKLCKDEVIRVYGKGGLLARINADQSIVPGRNADASIMAALGQLALDPTHTAVKHGQKTGICCFCGLLLTTAESVYAGYGPICSDKYGLPWGQVEGDESLEFEASHHYYYER